jgi:hypothetical protein
MEREWPSARMRGQPASAVHSKGNVCAKCGVRISGFGSEAYYRSADGLLMPVRKEQPPPDLRYFPWAQK